MMITKISSIQKYLIESNLSLIKKANKKRQVEEQKIIQNEI